jgi:translocation and assembly module TamA
LILGPGRSDIPADKRFYAGGADTVRGYDYQKAGDLDDEGDPIGGRSLLQFGADLRWSVTETIGLVPFIEAARAFDDNVPDFSKRLFWGTGLGVRWYTPLGPARIDVGLPLNRRDVDDAFEVYISIGQAF